MPGIISPTGMYSRMQARPSRRRRPRTGPSAMPWSIWSSSVLRQPRLLSPAMAYAIERMLCDPSASLMPPSFLRGVASGRYRPCPQSRHRCATFRSTPGRASPSPRRGWSVVPVRALIRRTDLPLVLDRPARRSRVIRPDFRYARIAMPAWKGCFMQQREQLDRQVALNRTAPCRS